MSAPYVLLGLLGGGPKHGYDLKHAYDHTLPRAKPLGFGQVYATLGRLERDGLVAQAGHDRVGGPDRTTFAITDAGRGELERWVAAVEPPAPHVAGALLTKVMVALMWPDAERAVAYLAAQRKAHTDRLRELTAAKTDPAATISDVIAADYAIAHLDADLVWLRTTLARVADLHSGVHG
ncbi:helix-turn-helix transcriptional regulator [Dactylosporangium sp. NPDC048998]|uniref:PadR family transcriptional regulator n=1 Tax=Dactylosporangium sp. NPDC048998 TaxID=3363976 RepID=UPI003717109F